MNKILKASALLLNYTNAYSSSLADCETFASLWGASCGGTNSTAVYTTSDWETTGAGVTTSNCQTSDSTVFAREPDTGTLVNSYSVFARNCITCAYTDPTDINTEVLIRM